MRFSTRSYPCGNTVLSSFKTYTTSFNLAVLDILLRNPRENRTRALNLNRGVQVRDLSFADFVTWDRFSKVDELPLRYRVFFSLPFLFFFFIQIIYNYCSHLAIRAHWHIISIFISNYSFLIFQAILRYYHVTQFMIFMHTFLWYKIYIISSKWFYYIYIKLHNFLKNNFSLLNFENNI